MSRAKVEELIAQVLRSKKAKRKSKPKAGKSLASLTATQREMVRAVRNLQRHPHPDNEHAIHGYRVMLESQGVRLSDYVGAAPKRKAAKRRKATAKAAPKRKAAKRRKATAKRGTSSERSRRPGETFKSHMARLRKLDGR